MRFLKFFTQVQPQHRCHHRRSGIRHGGRHTLHHCRLSVLCAVSKQGGAAISPMAAASAAGAGAKGIPPPPGQEELERAWWELGRGGFAAYSRGADTDLFFFFCGEGSSRSYGFECEYFGADVGRR
jgi:hypothetical protein